MNNTAFTSHPEQNTRNENEYAITFTSGEQRQTFYMFGSRRGAAAWAGREKRYFADGPVKVNILRVHKGGQA